MLLFFVLSPFALAGGALALGMEDAISRLLTGKPEEIALAERENLEYAELGTSIFQKQLADAYFLGGYIKSAAYWYEILALSGDRESAIILADIYAGAARGKSAHAFQRVPEEPRKALAIYHSLEVDEPEKIFWRLCSLYSKSDYGYSDETRAKRYCAKVENRKQPK